MRDEILGRDPIPSLIVRFSGPAIVALLAHALYNITDRVFVGRAVGSSGLAALSLAFPFMLAFISWGLVCGVGTSARMAISLGASDREGARRYLGNGILMALVGSVVMLALGFWGMEGLLRSQGGSGEILPMAQRYLRVILLGAPFSVLGMTFTPVLRPMGRPNTAMGIQLVGAFLNIALDWWWVMVLHMGVEGAAWATVASQVVQAFLGAALVLNSSRIRPRHMVPEPSRMGRIFSVGLPSGLTEMGFTIVIAIMNRQVKLYGGDAGLSALGIFFGLDALFFLPAIGVGEGAQPIIGYNYGAGNLQRVRRAIWTAVGYAVGYFCLSLLLVQIFAPELVSLFVKDDPVLLDMAAWGLRVSYAGAPMAGMSITAAYYFQGIGNWRAGLITAMCRIVIFVMIPLMILPPIMGITGVWASLPVADVGGCMLGFLMVRRSLRSIGACDPSGPA
ncbi:MATE family efflux transporter [Thermanaerovibrio acidaminovorans]|uniref:MATE family efflux transporter n=1 Tax=Thermanaerovibrio acidaminovorans TaxID=81462 RepID=UPI002492D0C7|nr:MATE family efflux transporter [Thermanaerovibrio acidaminovorans]